MKHHFIYRFFDARGALLYVGCTSNVARRFTRHRERSEWFKSAARHTIESGRTFKNARRREREVIYKEKPLYNVQGGGFRCPDCGRSASKAQVERILEQANT